MILFLSISSHILVTIYFYKYNLFLYSFHLPVYHSHHLQKLHLGEYPFRNKQSGEGFLLNYLREELKSSDFLMAIMQRIY
jgi:hypothetical protein